MKVFLVAPRHSKGLEGAIRSSRRVHVFGDVMEARKSAIELAAAEGSTYTIREAEVLDSVEMYAPVPKPGQKKR